MSEIIPVVIQFDILNVPHPAPTEEEWCATFASSPDLEPKWPDAPPEMIPQLRAIYMCMCRDLIGVFDGRIPIKRRARNKRRRARR